MFVRAKIAHTPCQMLGIHPAPQDLHLYLYVCVRRIYNRPVCSIEWGGGVDFLRSGPF